MTDHTRSSVLVTLVYVMSLLPLSGGQAWASTLYSQTFNTDASGQVAFESAYAGFTFSEANFPIRVTNGVVEITGPSTPPGFRVATVAGFQGNLLISADVGSVPGGDRYNVGLIVGDYRFVFHPGYGGGAFRVSSGGPLTDNINMGFTPATNVLHHMEVAVTTATGVFDVTITDGQNANNAFRYSFTAPASVSGRIGFSWGGAGNTGASDVGLYDNLIVQSVGSPVISVSATSLAFGNVSVGSSAQQTLSVSNTGNAALNVTDVTVSGTNAGEFSVSQTSFSVDAGASQDVTVTYSPTSGGLKSASLSIAHNASGSPLSIALAGNATDTPLGEGGYALEFDGDGDFVNIPHSDEFNTTEATAEFWFRKDNDSIRLRPDAGYVEGLLFKRDDYAWPFRITIGNATAPFTLQVRVTQHVTGYTKDFPLAEIDVPDAITPGVWYHVASVHASNDIKLYLQGELVGSAILIGPRGSNQENLAIGRETSYMPERFFNGQIDEVRIWGVARTEQEIRANMNRPLTGTEPGLVALYHFDSGSGTIAQGSAPNGHHGTLLGDPRFVPSTAPLTGPPPAPDISISPASLDFDSVQIGQSSSLPLTILNSGNADLSVTDISSSDGQFAVSSTSFTVGPGADQQLTVTFTPTSEGSKTATLTITSNDPGAGTVRLTVNGTGIQPSVPDTTVALPGGATMEMVWIEPGTFTMGSPSSEPGRESDEGPQHEVTISKGFYLGKYEVTQGQWEAAMGTRPWAGKDYVMENPDHPAVWVSWNDAQEFTGKLNQVAGSDLYRLSTEAEWEYACRAGTATRWSFGDDESLLRDYAWYAENAWKAGENYAHRVGTKLPNPWGLYDMHGNVWELVQDWYGPYTSANQVDPTGPEFGSEIVFRGCNFHYDASRARSAYRSSRPPSNRDHAFGFRLLRQGQAGISTIPEISVPASVSFGDINVGSSGQQALTVSNTGNATLNVTGITISGTNATEFSASPASFSVDAGTSQDVTVTFAPTSTGTKSGAITITHNASGSPFSVSLSGIGIDTTPPAAPSIPTAAMGANQVTLNWTANPELDLAYYVVYRSQTSDFTPAPSDSIARLNRSTTTYTNTGLTAGTYYFKIAAVDSSGNKSGPSGQASATIQPVISLSPSSLAFGTVNVGSSGQQTLTVSNTGAATLNVTGITISGTNGEEFSVSPASFSVNAGQSQDVVVTFSLASRGDRSASLSIAHNASGSPSSVSLSGQAVAPVIAVLPASIAFGNVNLNTPAQQTLTVSNTGDAALNVTGIMATGNNATEFPVSPGSFSVAAGQSQAVTVTFTPAAVGDRSASLAIAHNAGGSPATVPLGGTGVGMSSISLSMISLVLDNTNVGTTSQKILTISNIGTAELSVTGITVGGDNASEFSVSPTVATIAVGGNQTITVTFAPTADGSRTASLSIAHNAAGSPSPVTLSGTGVGVSAISVSATALAFANTDVGASSQKTFTVSNTGTGALSVTGITVGGDNASVFTISPATFKIDTGGAPQTVTVTFSPGSFGGKSASLSISHSAAGSPSLVALSGTGVVPVITVSAVSLPFGDVQVGQNKTLTFTVGNAGNTSLSVSDIAVSGTDSAQFTVSPKTFTVDADAAAQTVTVTFAPASTGVKSAALSIVHDAAGSPSSVTLSGMGVGVPVFGVSRPNPDFGNVPLGSSKTLTFEVSNTGSWDLTVSDIASSDAQYTVSPTAFTVAAGGPTQVVTVTFTPTSAQYVAVTLTVMHNAAGSPYGVTFSGSVGVPGFGVSRPNPDFGNVPLGSSKTLTFEVSNTGSGDLTVSDIASSDAQYTVSPTAFTVAAGGSAQVVTVTFAPTSAQYALVTLTVTHNAAGSPYGVTFSGTGSSPVVSVSASSLPFGDVQVGQNKTLTFTVGNTGNASLSVSDIAVSGTDAAQFTVSPKTLTVDAAAAAQTVTVTFAPTATGAKSASLSISHNAAGSPASVSLSGNGTEAPPPPKPVIALSVTALDAGTAVLGSSSQGTFTISNTGNASLSVTGITVSGADASLFTVSPTTATVPGGGSQTVTVTFTPASTGAKSATLSIAHDDTDKGTLTVSLSGTGAAAPSPHISVSASVISFGDVQVNQSAAQVLTVMNTGSADLSVSSIASADGQFTVSVASFTVGPGGSQPVTVTFTPASSGDKSATLTIASNDSDAASITVSLAGRGMAAATPAISIPPSAPAFGDVQIGQRKELTLTITNPGNAELSVTSISLTGEIAVFAVSPASLGVPPGGTGTVTMTFTPTSEGVKVTMLKLHHNAAGGVSEILVTGVGVTSSPVAGVAPSSLDFGDVRTGEEKVLFITISNAGAAELLVTSVTLSNADFKVEITSFSVSPGGSFPLVVKFAPTALGQKAATLLISHNDAKTGSPFTVLMTGTGVGPGIELSTKSLAFAKTRVGQNLSLTVTVSNVGTMPLQISDIMSSNTQFAVSPSSGTISAGGYLQVAVTFAPGSAGSHSSTLTISHNAAGSPFRISVSGTGSAPGISLIPSDSLQFGQVAIGQSEKLILLVSNTGDEALRVTGIVSRNPRFAVDLSSFTVVPGGNAQQVGVTFAPAAVRVETGALMISSDDPDRATVEVVLWGEGISTAPVDSPRVLSRNLAFGTVPLDSIRADTVRLVNPTSQTASGQALVIGTGFGLPTMPFPFDVAAGDTLRIPLTFTSAAPGDFPALLKVQVAGREIEVMLSATVLSGPALEVSPASIDFVQVEIGRKGEERLQVKNAGSGVLSIYGLQPSRLEFRVVQRDSLPIALGSGESRFLDVVFAPRSEQFVRGDLAVVSDAVRNPEVTVRLQGEGVQPAQILHPHLVVNPAEIAFRQLTPGQRDTAVLVLSNEEGLGVLFVDAITCDDAQVQAFPDSLVVDPGHRGRVQVAVEASEGGASSDTIRIVSNDPTQPVRRVPWRYESVRGKLDLALLPEDIRLQSMFGRTPTASLPVRNLGNGLLKLRPFSTDEQIVFMPDSVEVTPGGFTTVQARFLAASGGERAGVFRLLTNDPDARTVDITWSTPAALKVVSMTPEEGDTGVGQETEIRVTFDEPLLQTRAFIAIEAEMVPEPASGGVLEDMWLSDGGKTAVFPVRLSVDAAYRLVVSGATGVSGAQLDRVFVCRFTTGTAPVVSASIAGRVVSGDGGEVDGNVLVFAEDGALAAQEKIGVGGGYEVSGLPEGAYRIFADAFVDGVGQCGGCYDGNQDEKADVFRLGKGEQLTGMDVVLASATGGASNTGAAVGMGVSRVGSDDIQGVLKGVAPGEEFLVWVSTPGAVDLSGFLVGIDYDTTQVAFRRAESDGPGGVKNILFKNGGSALFIRPLPKDGRAELAGAILGASEAMYADGAGLLGIFRFVALEGVRKTEVRLSEAVLHSGTVLDSLASVAVCTVEGAVARLVKMDLDAAKGDQRQTRKGVRPGGKVTLQLFADGFPEVSGYSVPVNFDTTAVRYTPGSFQAGGFVPGGVAAASEREGELDIAVTSLTGGTAFGDGFLGQMTFVVLEGLRDSTAFVVTTVRLGLSGAVEQVESVRVMAYITEGQRSPDFDGDGTVGFPDFIQFAQRYGSQEGDAGYDDRFDLNGSGRVDFGDFLVFAQAYGKPSS